jgi:hypothetical protein
MTMGGHRRRLGERRRRSGEERLQGGARGQRSPSDMSVAPAAGQRPGVLRDRDTREGERRTGRAAGDSGGGRARVCRAGGLAGFAHPVMLSDGVSLERALGGSSRLRRELHPPRSCRRWESARGAASEESQTTGRERLGGIRGAVRTRCGCARAGDADRDDVANAILRYLFMEVLHSNSANTIRYELKIVTIAVAHISFKSSPSSAIRLQTSTSISPPTKSRSFERSPVAIVRPWCAVDQAWVRTDMGWTISAG